MKDTSFFNAESARYSAKRYPARAASFTQFFFKERLARTLDLLDVFFSTRADVAVLELGCADGVVADAISKRYGTKIRSFDANDIAPDMIAVAKELFGTDRIHFTVRDTPLTGPYDLMIETGVLNYLDLDAELKEVVSALAPDGRYVCSIAGRSSLQNLLKGGAGYRHLESYAEYEKEFSTYFALERRIAVGLFIPLLWKVPAVARTIQPVFERIGRVLAPSLYHEHVYVFKKR